MPTSLTKLPVFLKAQEILDIAYILADLIDEQFSCDINDLILHNAKLIPQKIAAAEGGNFYSLRVENAFLIKIAAKELINQLQLCRHLELLPVEYIQLLIREMNDFKSLFMDWVLSFDRSHDIEDDWQFLS